MVLQTLQNYFQTTIRIIQSVFSWIFRTEICMFLSVSGILLIFCVLESILHPEDNSESLEVLPLVNDSDIYHETKDGAYVSVEDISSFVPLVTGLFILLFLIWKLSVWALFGSLTPTEKISVSKSLFGFVLFRFIILSGAINPARLSSLFGWCVWFSVLGVLHMLTCVATSRCNQISASGSVTCRQWLRIFLTFVIIFVSIYYMVKFGLEACFLLADIDVTLDGELTEAQTRKSFVSSLKTPTVLGALKAKLTGNRDLLYDAVDVIALIISESALLLCTVSHLATGILIQAYDRWRLSEGRSWTHQTIITYYSELIFVCLFHLTEITHYLHLLLWSRVFSVASLVVFLYIRVSYSSLATRITRHWAHRRLTRYIADNYELCKAEKLPGKNSNSNFHTNSNKNDVVKSDESLENTNKNGEINSASVCAICWDTMVSWRRLPCNHDFHEHCLRSWLEQNPTCPTCRLDLAIPSILLPNNNNRVQRSENVALGVLVRNLFNNITNDNQNIQQQTNDNQPIVNNHPLIQSNRLSNNINGINNNNFNSTTTSATTTANNNNVSTRFATAIGFNLGFSFGGSSNLNNLHQNSTNTSQAEIVDNNLTTTTASIPSNNPTTTSTTTNYHPTSSANTTSNITQERTGQQTEPRNQIRRRSFHFDGSRYFSWLPSLHFELSEVLREVLQPAVIQSFGLSPTGGDTTGRSVTDQSGLSNGTHIADRDFDVTTLPSHLQTAVEQLNTMFPHFSQTVIINELLTTGLPDLAAENLLSRPVPASNLYEQTIDASEPGNSNVMNPTSPSTSVHTSIYNEEENSPLSDINDNPLEDIGSDNSFATRRRIMLAKARKSYLERQNT